MFDSAEIGKAIVRLQGSEHDWAQSNSQWVADTQLMKRIELIHTNITLSKSPLIGRKKFQKGATKSMKNLMRLMRQRAAHVVEKNLPCCSSLVMSYTYLLSGLASWLRKKRLQQASKSKPDFTKWSKSKSWFAWQRTELAEADFVQRFHMVWFCISGLNSPKASALLFLRHDSYEGQCYVHA